MPITSLKLFIRSGFIAFFGFATIVVSFVPADAAKPNPNPISKEIAGLGRVFADSCKGAANANQARQCCEAQQKKYDKQCNDSYRKSTNAHNRCIYISREAQKYCEDNYVARGNSLPRFPTKVWKFQKAPVTNAPTTDKPKKTRPSSTGTIMNTVPMKLYKTVPMKQKQN